jgi:hypothetical protein
MRTARLPTPAEIVAVVLRMGRDNEPHKCIAADTGLAQPTVSKILVRHGLRRVETKRMKQATA